MSEKSIPQTKLPRSPTPTSNSRISSSKDTPLSDNSGEGPSNQPISRTRASTVDLSISSRPVPSAEVLPSAPSSSRPHSPISLSSQSGPNGNLSNSVHAEDVDPFDYQRTVNELTIQFLSEFEETRVAALKWLIMLHQKAPKKVCPINFYMFIINSSDFGDGRWYISGFAENIVR